MPRTIKVDGRTIVVPNDATDEEINRLVGPAPSRVAGLPPGMDLPGLPTQAPITMREPQSIAGTIGSHLKNMVGGPYHAFTDDPRTPGEARMVESHGGINTTPTSVLSSPPSVNPVISGLNRLGLGASRMFVQPSIDAINESSKLRKAGGPQSSLLAPSTYDAQGNNIPTAGSKLIDAIPIYGPWARGAEDEANLSGPLAAGAGLLTDVAAPMLVNKGLGALRDAAPSMAEGAMGIRRGDRGYGKTPGRAILDETSGVRPQTVGAQAQAKLDELNPRITQMAEDASTVVPPNPVRGLLPAPKYDIPLSSSPDIPSTPSRPIILTQADRQMAKGLPSPRMQSPISSYTDIFPNQLPSAEMGSSAYIPSDSEGIGASQYFGQIPGERGGLGSPLGVLRTDRPAFAKSSSPATRLPPEWANPVSLTPARDVFSSASRKAALENSPERVNLIDSVGDRLNTDLTGTIGGEIGSPIPNNISPIQALNLKRGLRADYVKNWSPDAASITSRDLAKSASGVLDQGLDAALGPEFSSTNQRISSLIPITDAAEKLSRADELPQRFGDKLRAHTGALTSAVGGALAGGHSGGLLGAIGGGALGFALPELLGGPTAKMAIARGMDSPLPQALIPPLFTGGILNPKKGNQ